MNDSSMVSDGSSITFIDRREWKKADAQMLASMAGTHILSALETTSGIIIVTKDIAPALFNADPVVYRLARFSIKEDTGAIELYIMEVSQEQAAHIVKHGEWFT